MKKWLVAAMTLVFVLTGGALAAGSGDESAPLASTFGGSVAAETVLASPAADGGIASEWRFSVTPIAIWGLSISGPVAINGEAHNIHASFSDIKSSLNSAAGVGLTFGRGAWGGFFNGSYLKLLDEDVSSSVAPGVRADVSLEWTTLEFGGSWRLPVPPGAKSPIVEAMGGARYNQLRGGIEATTGATFDVERDISWTDPFVGMSINQPITERLAAVLRADVGGFGLSTNQTKYTWNFTAGVAYRWPFSGWGISAFGGYKINEYDYEKEDPTEVQLVQRMQGLVAALTFTF